jgi:hypothetical protein
MNSSRGPALTIPELEAKYSTYCKVLRHLLLEGRNQQAIERTVCWDRLATLHTSLPKRYKSPDYLFCLFRREIEREKTFTNG